MINEEEKLKQFMKEKEINGEHLRFETSLHTVQELLNVTGFDLKYITKTMVFKSPKGKTIAAMIPAEFRVSVSRLEKATGLQGLELTNPKEAYQRTGYPVGGMPFFGYESVLVIDPKVLELDYIYTGGGSEFSIVKITTEEIKRVSNPIVQRIRGKKSN